MSVREHGQLIRLFVVLQDLLQILILQIPSSRLQEEYEEFQEGFEAQYIVVLYALK